MPQEARAKDSKSQAQKNAGNIFSVSPTEQAILEALATFTYLTPEQMLRVGVTRDRSHLYAVLRTMRGEARKWVQALDFGALPGHGRLPLIYMLTEPGADLLREHRHEFDELLVKKPRLFTNDYFHRRHCVDFHISVMQWAERQEADLDFFHADYDPMPGGKGRPRKRTQVTLKRKQLVPDAVFSLTDREGAQRLFAYELYRGKRTARVIDQLRDYLHAIDEEAIETTYAYEQAVRVLVVFDDPDAMRLVQDRAQELGIFREYEGWFYLRALQEKQNGFEIDRWCSFDGAEKSLY